ncbi:MAG: phosphonate C-P lyase system protein PhnH [Gallionellaceae bacterium CG1_02_56_997]|nr:MAG: phosphonate C-P lyase system protein PhnH [Gallionellaceae bacterium CG1_02_56_997]PIR09154.1 MAG: phosphonate C-P lyase system protein PhnH [Gallionellaceae bacterium CG11_big_fil_rev_8_21_14_0_20_60_62]
MKHDMTLQDADIWHPARQQQLFRSLLDAFSYPGRIQTCPLQAEPWLALLSALLDGQATLSDPQDMLEQACWPKLEARRVPYELAAFILLDGSRAPERVPSLGTLEAPEGGATLLLRVASLQEESAGALSLQLTGPGIRQPVTIGVDGLHADWIAARNDWVSSFPLGVELVLCDARHFVALPRTTRIVIGGAA